METWCKECKRYEEQTSAGCIVCGTVNKGWKEKSESSCTIGRDKVYMSPGTSGSEIIKPVNYSLFSLEFPTTDGR